MGTLKYGCICHRNLAAGVNTVQEGENMFPEKFVLNSMRHSGEKAAVFTTLTQINHNSK